MDVYRLISLPFKKKKMQKKNACSRFLKNVSSLISTTASYCGLEQEHGASLISPSALKAHTSFALFRPSDKGLFLLWFLFKTSKFATYFSTFYLPLISYYCYVCLQQWLSSKIKIKKPNFVL